MLKILIKATESNLDSITVDSYIHWEEKRAV